MKESLNPKISIIIPVYNVEKYLRECLDSCINQTLEEIEIICIDDCSPDNSLKILEEYQLKDSRVKVLRHKTNKKQGAARNTGIENANGEYIWFIDSDDFIDTKACQILYDAIKKFDVDMLSFSAIQFEDDIVRKFFYSTKHTYCHKGVTVNEIYYPKTNWKKYNFKSLNVSPCTYLTKTSSIQNFRFREGVFHEDTDFTPILLASLNSFCFIPYTPYFRRINPESTTQRPMSQKRLEDLLATLDSLDKFITDNKLKSPHFLYNHRTEVIITILNLLPSCKNIQPEKLKNLYVFKKKYCKTQYSLKRFIGKIIKASEKLFKHD